MRHGKDATLSPGRGPSSPGSPCSGRCARARGRIRRTVLSDQRPRAAPLVPGGGPAGDMARTGTSKGSCPVGFRRSPL